MPYFFYLLQFPNRFLRSPPLSSSEFMLETLQIDRNVCETGSKAVQAGQVDAGGDGSLTQTKHMAISILIIYFYVQYNCVWMVAIGDWQKKTGRKIKK